MVFNDSRDSRCGKPEKKVSELEYKLSREHEVLSKLMESIKKSWGDLCSVWVLQDIHDDIVDLVHCWGCKTGIPLQRLVQWLEQIV